ncbi:MAG: hypothetical protein NTV82_00840, partial [Candidatus Aminicenantes bacterium]|nr:hypothetical protein [Candidatus Aminicenantes bacterium]
TPPPFPIERETPPMIFEPKGNEASTLRPSWTQPNWGERQWDDLDTPSFIRNKHSQLRKYPS